MSALLREFRGFLLNLRDGLRVFALAPFAPFLAIVPEFAQHAIEIRLGLFADLQGFRAHQMDALRTSAGSIKLLGLSLAVLFVARFWANRERGVPGWSLAGIAWRPLALGLLVQVLCSLPGVLAQALGSPLAPGANVALGAIMALVSLPGLVLMVAGALGDASLGLREAYRRGWGKALRIALYAGPAWIALQYVHEANHHLALGQSMPRVWGLMAFDSFVVGLMAALGGTGLHHGYGPPRINPKEVSGG
ncbi:hypothetical protein HT136_04745 [Novosphingobium profundi]|uniref:hypothetical protein n=1 Tax=Novosphingobium profundi TaxID=1774954 RepID=UPI001BDB5851|nr:hypothetical protein [Novosphingobium profundi]MBT0667670.1 hypothetical protein [Novosphingobium profundi]